MNDNTTRLIEPNGRPHIECPKCRTCVVWPGSLTSNQASTFAELVREAPVAAVRHAHDHLHLGLREAKALTFHVTKIRGTCHRCGTPVTGAESVCLKCRSANLDW